MDPIQKDTHLCITHNEIILYFHEDLFIRAEGKSFKTGGITYINFKTGVFTETPQ